MLYSNFTVLFGEWIYFRESFESLINRIESLSNIDRFHYLKSAVKAEPARALKTLLMSDSNYDTAWELLRKCYELIHYHASALFAFRTIRKELADELKELVSATVSAAMFDP